MIAIAASSAAFGQMKTAKAGDNSVQAKIIGMEKKGWETWKNQDPSFLQGVLSNDSIIVDQSGVADKAQYFKNSFIGCQVKSYSLDNFKVVR